jgi:hypothetical protein
MGAFFKFCVVLNLVAALAAGPLMVAFPEKWRQQSIDLGMKLGDSATALETVVGRDPFHTRFTGAAVFCIGVVGSLVNLISPSRSVLFVAFVWMILSAGIAGYEVHTTQLMYAVPLAVAATFHAVTYGYFWLTFGRSVLGSTSVRKTTKKN